MAADTLFHSEGSGYSMSLGSQINSKDSLNLLEEESPCKKPEVIGKSTPTSNGNTARDILVYPFIAGDLIDVLVKISY
jgi:hypothetical protein